MNYDKTCELKEGIITLMTLQYFRDCDIVIFFHPEFKTTIKTNKTLF